jgi:hypothetical protein
VKGPTLGLSQQVVEAGSSPILVAQGKVGAAPSTPGRSWYCQTGRVRQARREGVRVQEPAVEPPQVRNRLEIWRIWAGQQCTASVLWYAGVDSEAGVVGRWGGHEEGLRRTRGEAAGEQLGASLVDRSVGERGNRPGSPYLPPSLGGSGQARRQLMISGWDGVLVVVGGRESRSQGEGGQHDRSAGRGRSGARR